jgi:hypothetical protein
LIDRGVARRSRAASLSFKQEDEKMNPFQPLFHNSRVEEISAFIAAELRVLLDRTNPNSHLSRRMREYPMREGAAPATSGERVLATQRALNMLHFEVLADLALLMVTADAGESDDDKDEAA